MKKLLNTLYVTTEDAYASLDGENIVVLKDKVELGRFPLHTLQNIYLFTYAGASPALMGKCAGEGINLIFLSPQGRFLARVSGMSNGNVLLRRTQYRAADDPWQSCRIARCFIFGKLNNCRTVLDRARRDHGVSLDVQRFSNASNQLTDMMQQALEAESLGSLMGIEGAAATVYFGLFDDMILRNKADFYFHGRNRRPPLDNVNALLSYIYTLLGSSCAGALEAVGLDAYVGFLHRDHPGRTSLAQDLMEELRPCLADRFALTLINNRIVTASDFETQENGAVLMKDNCRKRIHKEWQTKKKETITHPYLKEKIEWGMIPYVQAMLLARYLRDDLDGYPPFLWR